MKKIFFSMFIVIGMIAITTPESNAQSFSISPYGGMSADQQGLISSKDPACGIYVQGQAKDCNVSFGLDMSGGTLYRVRIEDDSAKITFRKVNAPALTFVCALNIPDKNFNPFAGPVVGVEGGVAFPDKINYGPAGMIKVFTQINLGGDVGDYHLSCFVQGSFNFLYTKTTTYSSLISLGIKFTVPYAF